MNKVIGALALIWMGAAFVLAFAYVPQAAAQSGVYCETIGGDVIAFWGTTTCPPGTVFVDFIY